MDRKRTGLDSVDFDWRRSSKVFRHSLVIPLMFNDRRWQAWTSGFISRGSVVVNNLPIAPEREYDLQCPSGFRKPLFPPSDYCPLQL